MHAPNFELRWVAIKSMLSANDIFFIFHFINSIQQLQIFSIPEHFLHAASFFFFLEKKRIIKSLTTGNVKRSTICLTEMNFSRNYALLFEQILGFNVGANSILLRLINLQPFFRLLVQQDTFRFALR